MVNELMAAQQIGFPILSALVLIPVLLAVLIGLTKSDVLARKIALYGALAELALSAYMLIRFIPGIADIQFAEKGQWLPTMGAGYHLGVDGISVLFVPLTAFITAMVMLFSWNSVKFFNRFYLINLLLLEAATIGIFVSLDLILFYLFYELALIPSYFLIKLWGVGPQRQYAGLKYVTYMLIGSAPLLIGIVLLGLNYHDWALTQGLAATYSFDYVALLATPVDPSMQTAIFMLMAVGFAVKGPMLPFHTWMPSAIMEGPIGMGVFLVGLKVGAYGFIRFVIPLLPAASQEWFWLLAVVGLIAIVYGALIALVQPNFRRLLAFASVSHVGLVMVGLFSLNAQSMQGALLMMVNMGITATGLLFIAGFLHHRTGSTELSAFGGIARRAPMLAVFCFVIGLASIGMPGTSGFLGEFLTLLGAFQAHWAIAAVAVLGVILSAAYFLWYYERAFFGPVTGKLVDKLKDLNARELAIVVSITGLVFAIGLYPAPILNVTSGSVAALVDRLDNAAAAAPRSASAATPARSAQAGAPVAPAVVSRAETVQATPR